MSGSRSSWQRLIGKYIKGIFSSNFFEIGIYPHLLIQNVKSQWSDWLSNENGAFNENVMKFKRQRF